MKIPKEILQAPMDDLMSGDLRKTFKKIGYGGIPEWTNTGCTFFCWMDNKTCRDVKGKVHNVKMEYYEIDGYPLIRFDVVVYDNIDNPLEFDSFLNVGNEDHGYMLGALMEQEWIVFHWYGENFKYRGSTGVRWKKENREWVKEIWEKGRECIRVGGVGGVNSENSMNSEKDFNRMFDRAKKKFMRENPIY